MPSIQNTTCDDFLAALSSKSPTPGGGGAAALVGAIGIALSNMTAHLTIGKKESAPIESEIKTLLLKGQTLMDELVILADEDAKAFEPLAKAYRLPKKTLEEIAHRKKIIGSASKEACSVPIKIIKKTVEAIIILRRMSDVGSMIAISDVGCGAAFLKSSLIAARLNVLINLKSISDKNFIKQSQKEITSLFDEGCKIADETLVKVTQSLETGKN